MSFEEELAAIIAAEEERLGVGGEEFAQRHKEIMESAKLLSQQKAPLQSGNRTVSMISK